MRILYLNPIGNVGGAERSLLSLLASLRVSRSDWRLSLISSGPGQLLEEANELGVDAWTMPLPTSLQELGDSSGTPRWRLVGRAGMLSASIAQYVWQLRRAIDAARPDIIHTNGFKSHLLAAWARPEGVPLVWHIHDYLSNRSVMRNLMRVHAHRCSISLAVSESVAFDVRRTLGEQAQVGVLRNGVDLERFRPDGPLTDLDALCGLAASEPKTVRIVFVAVFAKWKGHEVFLRALARLRELQLPWRAYIVGGPVYATKVSQHSREALERLVADVGLTGRVGFTGYVANTEQVFRSADIVVHASTQPEPFGLTIVEAMASGRAVIASNGGGASELFMHGRDALGHAPGNVEELATRIKVLVLDGSLRQRLGMTAQRSAQTFDQRLLSSQIAPLYESAVTRQRKCGSSTSTAETSTAA